MDIATEIDVPEASIGIGVQVGVDTVNESRLFAQAEIEAGVHARPAQHVVEQGEGEAAVVKAPREVLPLLGVTERLDLLDLYGHGMSAKAENSLGGQSELLEKTENRLKLKTSEAGTWEMRLFRLEADSLILVIHSVKAIGVQSEVSAYRTNWTPAFVQLPSPSLGRLIDMASSSISPLRKQELLSVLREQPIRVEFTGEKQDLLTYAIDLSGVSLFIRKL